MKRSPGFSRPAAAFTLIELLVVISIIAVLAAGVGLALRGNNPESSLRSAQGLMVGALSSARGQAALAQTETRLVLQADSGDANFLRSIRVVAKEASDTTWKQVGNEIILPEGVYVIPPQGSTVTGVTFDETAQGGWIGAKKTNIQSSLFEATPQDLNTIAGMEDAEIVLWSKEISSLGTVEGGGDVFVTSGRKTGAVDVFLDNVAATRGLRISRYGVANLINDTDSL